MPEQPSTPLSSDISSFSSPLPSAEPESSEDDQIEIDYLKARIDNMMGKHQGKRRKIPLDIHICKEERVEGKVEPEWRTLKSQRAGTVVEAPGQPRLSSRGMQKTTVDWCTHADGSSEPGEFPFFKPLSESNPI